MYSFHKAKKIFFHTLSLYNDKKGKSETSEAKQTLEALQTAIIAKDKPGADRLARKAKKLSHGLLAKNPFIRFRDSLIGLITALFIALIVRSMWFELYEIPSGSMRPTFKEQDKLVVSKTTFGINFPLQPKHLLFEPSLVKRAGVFVWSGQGMDIPNNDAMYFYLIPGKKQYVKRLMGKPGDRLYFYGGKIYGIDRDGNDITNELEPAILDEIDHVPFLSFAGETKRDKKGVTIYQMGKRIAKLTPTPFGTAKGKLLQNVPNYGDLWGFKNFAMARINQDVLELSHSPKLDGSTFSQYGLQLHTETSTIPLTKELLQTIMNGMYTARFEVKNGVAFRPERGLTNDAPKLKVEDGTYEFYHGIAYKIPFGGITKKLDKSHPIYSVKNTKTLFNLGIDFSTYLSPPSSLYPRRYAYYRDGDLYVMGKPFLKKGAPELTTFTKKEQAKHEVSARRSYLPFIDNGAPSKKTIEEFGLTITDNHYLALGDNHAMSADSRVFGFIPEGNVRGAPSFIFWPPGNRFGPPLQISYPFFTLPNGIIYSLALISFVLYRLHRRKHYSLPVSIE